jgi:hypothetical protein
MVETVASEWNAFMILVAVFLYFEAVIRMDERFKKQIKMTDEEYLTRLAKKRGISEYDLFFQSAEQWSVFKRNIDEDFKEYLINDHMPHYVRDYIRKAREAEESGSDQVLDSS